MRKVLTQGDAPESYRDRDRLGQVMTAKRQR